MRESVVVAVKSDRNLRGSTLTETPQRGSGKSVFGAI